MRIFFLAAFILAAITLPAQTTKLDREAYSLLHSSSIDKTNAFVKGDIEKIRSIVTAHNGTFRFASGNIASVSIDPSALKELSADPSILRIEAHTGKLQLMNDSMLRNNNVIPVHAGLAPLPQGYDGTGVVMGIIDSGIDFTHPDFKDSSGNTRIKYLWDQTQPAASNTPLPYSYGQEWDSTGIQNGNASAHNDLAYFGHGTHVTGIAAGNGLAINKYKGVAPNADIIVVALDFNNPNGIADAADYIYAKAQTMGKPCVINASVGDYYGSHDGKNLEAQLIDNLITAQSGRAFVAAAGNGGNVPFHLGYTVNSDTSFTWFDASAGGVVIELWADTANLQNVDIAIGADMTSPYYSFRGRTPFMNIAQHIGFITHDTIYNNNNRIGIIDTYGQLIGGVYSMAFNITADSSQYLWKLMATGAGRFDTWNFNVISSNLPSTSAFPPMAYYKMPDTTQTIVSSFQCLDNVITVASYNNRNSHIDYNNNVQVDTTVVPQALAFNSSVGPTRDGRQKPDIAASGAYTISCAVLSMAAYMMTNAPWLLDQGGYHTPGGGTSAASPIVAGIAALYLQAHPNATAAQVKNAITSCTRQDQFTGSSPPDYSWGYGKVDAYQTLVGCTTGIEETSTAIQMSIYPNPSSGHTVIQYDLSPGAKHAQLVITNMLGEIVKRADLEGSSIYLDNSGLEAGIYFCTILSVGQKPVTEKMVIL